MAKIHSIDPSNLLPPSLTIDREPKLFQNLKKYLDLLPEKFDDETKHRRFYFLSHLECLVFFDFIILSGFNS
jgi:hypothetical protein